MTFSIVAFDEESVSWGVAVASKCLSVGHVVPWGRAGAGALATQALANITYGPRGIELLSRGTSAKDVVSTLVGDDPLSPQRQLGIVDAKGGAETYTGTECLPWCGGAAADRFAVQGNILIGERVISAMVAAYRSHREAFSLRLLRALTAGDTAGGDRRGRQSAAMRIWREGAAYGGGLDIALDLRVDDHIDPVAELRRLERLHFLYFGHPDPESLLPLEGDLKNEVEGLIEDAGFKISEHGDFDTALERWIGTENFEERHVRGRIDPLVLDHLRQQGSSRP